MNLASTAASAVGSAASGAADVGSAATEAASAGATAAEAAGAGASAAGTGASSLGAAEAAQAAGAGTTAGTAAGLADAAYAPAAQAPAGMAQSGLAQSASALTNLWSRMTPQQRMQMVSQMSGSLSKSLQGLAGGGGQGKGYQPIPSAIPSLANRTPGAPVQFSQQTNPDQRTAYAEHPSQMPWYMYAATGLPGYA